MQCAVFINTHTPLTQRSQNGLTMLSRMVRYPIRETNSHGTRQDNARPQSSQFADPPWTDSGLKSGKSAREMISTSKKKKKHRRGNDSSTLPPNPRMRGKASSTTQCSDLTGKPEGMSVVPRAGGGFSLACKDLGKCLTTQKNLRFFLKWRLARAH